MVGGACSARRAGGMGRTGLGGDCGRTRAAAPGSARRNGREVRGPWRNESGRLLGGFIAESDGGGQPTLRAAPTASARGRGRGMRVLRDDCLDRCRHLFHLAIARLRNRRCRRGERARLPHATQPAGSDGGGGVPPSATCRRCESSHKRTDEYYSVQVGPGRRVYHGSLASEDFCEVLCMDCSFRTTPFTAHN